MMKRLKGLWCEVVNDSVMWPIHGHYQCRVCGRRYPVPWTSNSEGASQKDLVILTHDGRLAPRQRRIGFHVGRI